MNLTADHDLFKALAELTRLRIMILLLGGELCVCDLTAVLRLPQSTVSRHMARLKSAGMVRDRRAGKWVHYAFNDSPSLIHLKNYLDHLRPGAQYELDRQQLEIYMKEKKC